MVVRASSGQLYTIHFTNQNVMKLSSRTQNSVTVYISNVKCQGCAKFIKNLLNGIPGIDSVQLNSENGQLIFSYDRHEAMAHALSRLAASGYPTSDSKNSFLTKGKSYISCSIGRTIGYPKVEGQ